MSTMAIPSTDELAQRVNEEHGQIRGSGDAQLKHAIRAGEFLLEAQKHVPKNMWTAWMQEHLEMHVTTAYGYMRLARHKEQVLEGNYSGIDPALAGISGERRLTSSEKDAMRELYADGKGKSLGELATQFNVRKSTVSYWVSAKNRDRIKRLQRHKRGREKKAAQRERTRRKAIDVKGPLAAAYGLVRRAEQAIDQQLTGTETQGERLELMEILEHLYEAEDRIGVVIRRVGS